MDLLNALDILVGLIVIYLVVAIACTVINEWIDTIAQVRAKKLQDTILEMFGENVKDSPEVSALKIQANEAPTGVSANMLANTFFNNRTIRSLYRKNTNSISNFYKKEDPPTYISAKLFREVLFTMMPHAHTMIPLCKVTNFSDLQDSIDAISNDVVKSKLDDVLKSVQQTADDSTNKFLAFNKGVEDWYNESMERTSDWYKRKVQLWTFVSGSFLCIALNVDTISMARYFSDNPTDLEVYVNAAQKIAQMQTFDTLQSKLGVIVKPKPAPAQGDSASKKAEAASPQNSPPTTAAAEPALTNPLTGALAGSSKPESTTVDQKSKLSEVLSDRLIQGGTLPLGWNNTEGWDNTSGRYEKFWLILSKILGLFISIAAVSVGAPFWFDTLSRIMNIRSSLKEISNPNTKKL